MAAGAAVRLIEKREGDCLQRLVSLLNDPIDSVHVTGEAEATLRECLREIERDLSFLQGQLTSEDERQDLEKAARRVSEVIQSAEAVLFDTGQFKDVATLAERASEKALVVFRLAKDHIQGKDPRYLDLLATAETVLMQRSAGHYADIVISSSAKPTERRQAALDLRRFGVWIRHDSNSRGTLDTPACGRGGELERKVRDPLPKLSAIVQNREIPRDIRISVIPAIGEFGGSGEAESLLKALSDEEDEDIIVELMGALGVIGGPAAVSGFGKGLQAPSERIQRAVLAAIGDLIAKDHNRLARGKFDGGSHPLLPSLRRVVDAEVSSEFVRVRAKELLHYFEQDWVLSTTTVKTIPSPPKQKRA